MDYTNTVNGGEPGGMGYAAGQGLTQTSLFEVLLRHRWIIALFRGSILRDKPL